MTHKLLATLPIIIFLFGSCQKNNQKPTTTFPFSVKAKKIEKAGDIRLFNQEGEVKDERLIKTFVEGVSGFQALAELSSYDSITFLSDSIAHFGISPMPYQITLKTQNQLSFQHKVLIPPDRWSSPKDGIVNLLIGKGTVIEKEANGGIPGMAVYTTMASGTYESFRMPVFYFRIVRRYENGFATHMDKQYGEFNESFLETLNPGDMVAFQQVYIRFEK